VTNLVGNAIKFTSEGEVAVEVSLEEAGDGADRLRFEVIDTGIGIPEARLADLFEAFTQADVSTTRKYGGTGLGLSISKALAEMMGGEIGVRSELGVGSTFWFTVVFAHPEEAAVPGPERKVPDVRVLVVDDNARARRQIALLLDALGVRHDLEPEGEAAARRVAAGRDAGDPYGIVVLDDGIVPDLFPPPGEAARVALAPLGSPVSVKDLRRGGFATSLAKPVKLETLRTALLQALGATAPPDDGVVAEARPGPDVRAARILLVEDNPTNQKVAIAMLDGLGHDVELAENGREAMERLGKRRFDLVLMDCQMPVLDGYDATRAIRDPDSGVLDHEVPVIAMTAHAQAGDRDKCLAAGMNDYLSKPIHPERLQEMVAGWTPDHPVAAGEDAPPTPPAEEPSPSGPALFDRDGLLERLMGSDELVAAVLDSYLDDVPRQLDALRSALEEGDPESVRRVAHGLKGASANVGSPLLADLAARIEQAAIGAGLDEVRTLFAELEAGFGSFREHVASAREPDA
jgi:CheY-like chemotaxis protein/HPt (histidine-containing phosphotransfer) domain-containing protein